MEEIITMLGTGITTIVRATITVTTELITTITDIIMTDRNLIIIETIIIKIKVEGLTKIEDTMYILCRETRQKSPISINRKTKKCKSIQHKSESYQLYKRTNGLTPRKFNILDRYRSRYLFI